MDSSQARSLRAALLRTAGFLAPTLVVVPAVLLGGESGDGWFDAIASGLFFGLLFLVGALAYGLVEPQLTRGPRGTGLAAFVIGLASGALFWVALWAMWALPVTHGMRDQARVVNFPAAMLAGACSGFVTGARSRPEPVTS